MNKTDGKQRRLKKPTAVTSARLPLRTISEAAAFLQVNPRTVREFIRRGELNGRLIGGRWRFRQEDLDAFFDAAPSQWDFYRDSARQE